MTETRHMEMHFKNHAEIAEFWNIFLDGKLRPMANITAKDVAIDDDTD